jgi:hypothetical protein
MSRSIASAVQRGHLELGKRIGNPQSSELEDRDKKSPGTWHAGAQGGRDGDLGCWGDEGIAVSIPIIDNDGFNTVNQVTEPIWL